VMNSAVTGPESHTVKTVNGWFFISLWRR
jgi:hypothetical protein